MIDTDVLIVGAGPTGLSLACFLGTYGIRGIVVSNAPSTVPQPRANYLNVAALECYRDIGIDSELCNVATPMDQFPYIRYCKTLAGEELFRMYGLASDPLRKGEWAAASPCEALNLPQQRLEPVLLSYASQRGFHMRFSTELLTFVQNEDGSVEASVRDNVANQEYTIRAKYLCGSDGGNSNVAAQLGLKFEEQPMGSLSLNVEIEAEMGHLMRTTPGFLTTLTGDPETDHDKEKAIKDSDRPPFANVGLLRALKPWNEWTMILFCDPSLQRIDASDEQIMTRIRELIADDSVEIKIKGKYIWRIKDSIAETFSKGSVYCAGDAVHRHPPHNGLGANTCIQDAYNLAWKLAMVLKGQAGKGLLQTYTSERQPVGKYVVFRANEAARVYFRLYGTLGLIGAPAAERLRLDKIVNEDSAEGQALRDQVRDIRRDLEEDYGGLGSEVNQWYQSTAVYTKDEAEEPQWPTASRDRTMRYYESTYPGFKVPHVWLTKRKTARGSGPGLISTRDLCGKGVFTLLTGVGGQSVWLSSVDEVHSKIGIGVTVIAIGWSQEYEDTFFQWREKREVAETGAILVRPDLTVAWRCKDGEAHSRGKLLGVMKRILCL